MHATLSAAASQHKQHLCIGSRSKLQPNTSFAVTSDSRMPNLADATQFSIQSSQSSILERADACDQVAPARRVTYSE